MVPDYFRVHLVFFFFVAWPEQVRLRATSNEHNRGACGLRQSSERRCHLCTVLLVKHLFPANSPYPEPAIRFVVRSRLLHVQLAQRKAGHREPLAFFMS